MASLKIIVFLVDIVQKPCFSTLYNYYFPWFPWFPLLFFYFIHYYSTISNISTMVRAPRRCPPWPWPLPNWHYVGCRRCRRCWACAWDTKPWASPRRTARVLLDLVSLLGEKLEYHWIGWNIYTCILCVYIYIYMCICMYMYTYIYIYTVCVCICIYMIVNVYRHMYIYRCILSCVYIYMW